MALRKQLVCKVHQPAYLLNAPEQQYFSRIVESREHGSWCPNHLALASELARTMRQLDEANLAINGGLVINGRANPAVQIKVSLSNVIVGLNRLLGLSASQKGLSVTTKSKQDNKSDITGQFDDLKLFSFDD
jgi:phage terminase small subunit